MKVLVLPAILFSLTAAACAPNSGADSAADPSSAPSQSQADAASTDAEGLAKATFAGGCFWCMEPPFDKLDGVVSTTSGYIDGHVKNPTYQQVTTGTTGHTEAVEVVFDPAKVSFEELLHVFWRNIDPLAVDRQFCDGGSQYRTGIYTHDDEQLRLSQASKDELESSQRFDRPIATEIKPATEFYPAEDYHQDYYTKNPIRYKTYRTGCGRDRRLKQLWGDEAP